MSDKLSLQHYNAVRTEIEGRFFTQAEADQLKLQIDRRIITDPKVRAEAAKTWPEPTQ